MPELRLFEDGVFRPERVGDPVTAEILAQAADRAAGQVQASDLLQAALAGGVPRVLAKVEQALRPGVTVRDVVESLAVVNPPRSGSTTFGGRRESFSQAALAALDQFEAEFGAWGENAPAIALELLMTCVLRNLENDTRAALPIFDAERAEALFAKQLELEKVPLPPLFDVRTSRLRSDEFTQAAWAVLEQAAVKASELGFDRMLAPHCLLALLAETEGVTEHLFRLQAPVVGPAKTIELIAESFRIGEQRADVDLVRDQVGETMVGVLQAAQRHARLWGLDGNGEAQRVDSAHLLAGLLDQVPPRLEATLRSDPLNLELARMRRQLVDYLRDPRTRGRREVAFRLPGGLLPSEDLTYRLRTAGLPSALHVDPYLETMTRALFRRENNHLLVTGFRGVGKTALIQELARRAGSGEIEFLARKRFLWVDCATVARHQSKEKLAGLLAHVGGRSDVIVCLDGLGPLLRAESGSDNKMELRAALKSGQLHLIGVMANSDYEDLVSADPEFGDFFTRVSVEEPPADAALAIVVQGCTELEREFGLAIEAQTSRLAVRLSADYIMNERLPAKAIRILRRACENVHYERKQHSGEVGSLGRGPVTRVVAEITGIPVQTLEGRAGEVDYQRELSRAIVGQDHAVEIVASQLRGIKAGLPDPGKPASVMLFAGLTGVGKTELAKALARFYSASKRLQTYTMENFTEPHSVSGILGSPPGYIGHDQGGRLINDLNSDPYCVFLLDEAEKAHPEVWKPFLNLFDEAWIVDQRGVKAFADRAIFILTSNAGDRVIARMSREGADMRAIEGAVRDVLAKVTSRDGNIVFPAEFLARIHQIVVFTPLDEEAMREICRMAVARMADDWQEKRGKRLVVPEALVSYIAWESHQADEGSEFNEGGRIVRKLIAQLIRDRILAEQALRPDEYQGCNVIELRFETPPETLPDDQARRAHVGVQFRAEPVPTGEECLGWAADELRRAATDAPDASAIQRRAADCLARLEARLDEARHAYPASERVSFPLDRFRAAMAEVEQAGRAAADEAIRVIESLAASLGEAPQAATPNAGAHA
jgi:ATP-dependent Clp protease ATP-binding subunit ClpC